MDEWTNCHVDDLWIFDKLILAKKLGYKCGPKGTPVPKPDYYIVRPCVNFMGMGRGAYITFLQDDTDNLIPDGTFWCEVFTGRHLSIDFYNGEQVLCVEGHRSSIKDLTKWDLWEMVGDEIQLPKILTSLEGVYSWINVEMINRKIIEVHLRKNQDFADHNSPYIIPVYENDKLEEDHVFINAPEHNRLGFLIPKGVT